MFQFAQARIFKKGAAHLDEPSPARLRAMSDTATSSSMSHATARGGFFSVLDESRSGRGADRVSAYRVRLNETLAAISASTMNTVKNSKSPVTAEMSAPLNRIDFSALTRWVSDCSARTLAANAGSSQPDKSRRSGKKGSRSESPRTSRPGADGSHVRVLRRSSRAARYRHHDQEEQHPERGKPTFDLPAGNQQSGEQHDDRGEADHDHAARQHPARDLPSRERRLVHFVNLFIFALTLLAFHFFLRHWLLSHTDDAIGDQEKKDFVPFAFCTFLWFTLEYIGVGKSFSRSLRGRNRIPRCWNHLPPFSSRFKQEALRGFGLCFGTSRSIPK